MAAYEEEEEEEDEFWYRRPAAAPVRSRQAEETQSLPNKKDEEDDEVEEVKRDMEDTSGPLFERSEHLFEGIDFSTSLHGSGLRQRHPLHFASPVASDPISAQFRGGLLGPDEDFALGSERLHDPPRTQGSGVKPALRPLVLALVGMSSVLAFGYLTTPREASFRHLRDARYQRQNADPRPSEETGRLESWLAVVLSRDRSFDGHVAWSRYVNHGPFALASVALSVANAAAASGQAGKPAKAQKSGESRKVYEHRYLGLLGLWLPLPYLPQPGQKANTFGVGLCLLSRCVCVPDPRKGSKSGGGAKSGRGCWRFRGGKSAALNVMAIPNGLLFFLWQWPSYWSMLAGHTTLSLANLSRGRLWVLLTAAFSHRGWGEIFTTALLLTNTLDSFDHANVSFSIFFILYIGGCWMSWLVSSTKP